MSLILLYKFLVHCLFIYLFVYSLFVAIFLFLSSQRQNFQQSNIYINLLATNAGCSGGFSISATQSAIITSLVLGKAVVSLAAVGGSQHIPCGYETSQIVLRTTLLQIILVVHFYFRKFVEVWYFNSSEHSGSLSVPPPLTLRSSALFPQNVFVGFL